MDAWCTCGRQSTAISATFALVLAQCNQGQVMWRRMVRLTRSGSQFPSAGGCGWMMMGKKFVGGSARCVGPGLKRCLGEVD